jgi:hypothetical protein
MDGERFAICILQNFMALVVYILFVGGCPNIGVFA